MKEKVLIVDDDRNILEGYKRALRRQFTIETALGGNEGLEIMTERGPYAVVVSDMRMPGMDGTEFLSQVRARWPDSVRLLLTGQADMADAIAVINEGQIFRFLTKPCPPELFGKSLNDGIEQYRLVTAEKELLEKTLKGSIKLLIDIVSIISPELFSRSLRVRSLANKLALRLKLDNLWQVDVAALLAQIGSVTIPSEITKKKWQGEPLSADEQQLFIKHLEAGKTLVENIPRLEKVAEAILYQEKEYDGGGFPRESRKGTEIPLIARILKIVHDYEILMTAGKSPHEAISDMFCRANCYDAELLAAFKTEVLTAEEAFVIREIPVRFLRTGMVLADNVRTKTNLLLVAKRQEISDTLRLCILGFAEKGNIVEPIKVIEWQEKTPEVQKVKQESEGDSDSCASIIDAVSPVSS